MTARLDLAMQLDEWRHTLDDSMQVLRDFSTILWSPEPLETARWSIILSIHYYFTILLIDAPVLTIALTEAARHWPADFPSSMLHQSFNEVLQVDFEAAKNLRTIVKGLHSLGGPFIDCHAIWFLCNYSSTCHSYSMTPCTYSLTEITRCSVYGFPPRLWHPTISYMSTK